MRTLAITQNITVDGSIVLLGNWFDPHDQGAPDRSDLLAEQLRQGSEADGFLVGRLTFEGMRGYWPEQVGDATGITRLPQPGTEIRRFPDHDRPAMGELHGPLR